MNTTDDSVVERAGARTPNADHSNRSIALVKYQHIALGLATDLPLVEGELATVRRTDIPAAADSKMSTVVFVVVDDTSDPAAVAQELAAQLTLPEWGAVLAATAEGGFPTRLGAYLRLTYGNEP